MSGASVSGLLINVRPTATARLARHQIAHAAAGTVWKGIGTTAQKTPIAKARATDPRFKCHRSGA